MVETTYDAPVPMTQMDRLQKTFSKVNEVIEEAVAQQDPEIAFALADDLVFAQKMSGLSLAMFLSEMEDRWFMFEDKYDNFEDMVYVRLGKSKQTVKKYIGVWREIFLNQKITDKQKEVLFGFPIKRLLLLVPAVREGSITKSEWGRVTGSTTDNEVREIILEVRGEQKSASNALRIFVNTRGATRGRLSCRVGSEGKKIPIGHIQLDSEDEQVQKAVARILNSAGVIDA